MTGTALITRLGDYSLPWMQLRGRADTLVTADDTPLNLSSDGGEWDNKPAEPEEPKDTSFTYLNCVPAVAVNIGKLTTGKASYIEIIGYGTNAPAEACAWILYAYRGRYSPVIRVAEGTAILGTMDCVKDPVTNTAITAGFYTDTWGITSDYWGTVAIKDNADNAASRMMIDFRGYQYLYMEMLPAAGTCASFGAAFSGV